VPTPTTIEKPDYEALLGREDGALLDRSEWTQVADLYRRDLARFPEDPRLREGKEFADAMVTALGTEPADHAERLAKYEEARAKAGAIPSVREDRETLVGRASTSTLDAWIDSVISSAGENWVERDRALEEIELNPAVSRSGMGERVSALRQFAGFMSRVERYMEVGNFADAARDCGGARQNAGEDAELVAIADERRGEVKAAWIDEVRKRIARIPDSPEGDAEFYEKVIAELDLMARVLQMDRGELVREFPRK
jgi:hypothetical protein